MAEGRLSGRQVWVLRFTTKHGTDIYLFSNEKNAERGALKIIRENLDELDDEDADRIEAAFREKRWKDVFSIWHGTQEDRNEPMTLELDPWTVDEFLHGAGPKEWFPG